jgi:hypothetical protein
MVFHWAAVILEAWLALARAARSSLRRPLRARSLWRALPGDLLGLFVMRACGIARPTREVDAGDVTAVLVEDPRVELWFRAHLMPVAAQTLGRYVFAREQVPPDILAHECEHIRQWGCFGPFYLPLYFGLSAVAWVRGRRAYWDNHFEAAARRRAEGEMDATRSAGRS